MKQFRGVQFVAVMMAVLMPAAWMSAEVNGAMVYVTNSASLNGTPFTRSSTVFPGDKLAVRPKSSATIVVTGSSILVPATSNVTFNGDSVSLDHNAAVAVATSSGMSARVDTVFIVPTAKTPSKFEVARYNGNIYVAAKLGSVTIADASGSHMVAEGATTSVPDPEPQKPGAVPATTGAGINAGEIPTWVAVLIGLAAAGGAAAAAIATTGKPSSPAHP